MLILKEPILRKAILSTAFPAMMEMILYMLIGVVDIAMVGRLGAAPLAAVGLGTQIFFTLVLLEALGIGSSILVAHARGSGRIDDACRITQHTLLIGLLLGIIIAVLGLVFAGPLLKLFSVEPMVYNLALIYLRIIFWAAPLSLTFYLICSLFRGYGRTDVPMYIAVVVNIVNCVGNYVLVFGNWGLPSLGVGGAALASSLAHITGFLIAVILLIRGRQGLSIRLANVFHLQMNTIKDIFRLGLPSLGEQSFTTFSGLASTFLIVFLGTHSLASHEIALTVESLSFMPGIGISVAATALVGCNAGAKSSELIIQTARGSLELAVCIMGALGLLFISFPYMVAGLFTNDPTIIITAGVLVRIAGFEQIGLAVSTVLGGILKGLGDTRTPMYITTIFSWGYRLPLMFLIIRIWQLPIIYVWVMFVSDWIFRALFYCNAYRGRVWRGYPYCFEDLIDRHG